jgi:hypothetical protein
MPLTKLEKRVATLERKLSDLADKVKSSGTPEINAWIDQIHGTFQNDATYRQAARLGREWRKSAVARPSKKTKSK